ncbi:MAG TPA: succinate dehydrogenase, hydrophobic membrane anchor protein [Casimicrobiaceae bacterium]|jgi:succinate dehydrogenase / fumarate reductase membrane anchor subunit
MILSGLRAWTVQRLGALYLLVFLLFAVAHIAAEPPQSYAQWRAWVMSGGVRTAVIVFFAALLLHAWVGLRDVILDYVKPLPLRATVLAIVAAGLALLGAWVVQILVGA